MTLGQALWASINLQHLGTMEAPLEKFRSFPFVSFFFFSLCQPVRTHRTMAFGVILINISRRRHPTEHTALCCWHRPRS